MKVIVLNHRIVLFFFFPAKTYGEKRIGGGPGETETLQLRFALVPLSGGVALTTTRKLPEGFSSMPRSKRARLVTLSKVSKKGREWKEGVIENVRDAVDKYPTIYVFKYKDMKNNSFKKLRDKLRDTSRFFLGSNKVLQVALGREPSDEVRQNVCQLTKHIKGHVGLLFTEMPIEEVSFEEEEGKKKGRIRPLFFLLFLSLN